MFDVGWTELMVIGVVGLIVIGPKDLPDMFRTMGRFTAKARSMARDFQRAMEAAADEAGVKDVAKDLKNATSARSLGLDALKDTATKFEKWDPLKPAPKPVAAKPVAAKPVESILADATPAAPMGPATKALADAQAAKRAAAVAPQPAAINPKAPVLPKVTKARKLDVAAPAVGSAKPSTGAKPKPAAKSADAATSKTTLPKTPAKSRVVRAKPVVADPAAESATTRKPRARKSDA